MKNNGSHITVWLPENPEWSDVFLIKSSYENLPCSNLNFMLDRFECRSDYPWLDMKFDPRTGMDTQADDPIRGLDVVYGWVQGRALESLACHAMWLRDK